MTRLLKLSAPLLAIAFLLSVTAFTQADDDDQPTLEGVDLGTHVYGPEVEAEDLEGKVIIYEYWGDRCPPCIASIPHIVKLKETYGDKLVIVANQVWTKDTDKAKSAWTNAGGSDTISVINHGKIDGAAHRGVPHSYVFDHEGNFLWNGNPHPRADGKKLDEVVKKAVAKVPDQS